MKSAFDIVKEKYLNENELASILNVDTKRIRDLRSHHAKGKEPFIPFIKPTSQCILFRIEDVLAYLEDQQLFSFGISNYKPDSNVDSDIEE